MKHVLSMLALSTALSHAAFAKPIEDGSSFTGNYLVQEQACEKSQFSYVTGQNILVPTFAFTGTPEGLNADGNLIPLSTLTMIDHGEGIQTGVYANYVSSEEFVDGVVVIDPLENNGQKTVTVDNYKLETADELVKTTTTTIGSAQPQVSVCHFLRTN